VCSILPGCIGAKSFIQPRTLGSGKILRQQWFDEPGQRRSKCQVLVGVKVDAIHLAGGDYASRIEEMAGDLFTNLPIRRGQANAPSFPTPEFLCNWSFWLPDFRRRDNQYGRYGHAGFNRRPSDRIYKGENALRRIPCVVIVRGLEVIGPEHEQNKAQRRVNLDALCQTDKTVSAGLEGIVPHGAAAVQAVLDDADFSAGGAERDFHNARPSLVERQALACHRYNAPRQRIGIDKDLLHRGPAQAFSDACYSSVTFDPG